MAPVLCPASRRPSPARAPSRGLHGHAFTRVECEHDSLVVRIRVLVKETMKGNRELLRSGAGLEDGGPGLGGVGAAEGEHGAKEYVERAAVTFMIL